MYFILCIVTFFLFALKITSQNMCFSFSFKPLEITDYHLFMQALFSLKMKEKE